MIRSENSEVDIAKEYVPDTVKDTKKLVVVFDIDGVMCKTPAFKLSLEQFQSLHSECPTPILFQYNSEECDHYFPPYLEVLFKYLIENGCRIAFFSAGIDKRNKYVLELLLSSILGEECYQKLKLEGQFDIFSREHLTESDYLYDLNGGCVKLKNKVKDLKVVLQVNESLENSILIEDQPLNVALNSRPCIMALNLHQWDLLSSNNEANSFYKNSVYYLLGIFISYFNKYQHLLLRNGIDRCFSDYEVPSSEILEMDHYFMQTMINLGWKEVKKYYDSAVLYGSARQDARYSTMVLRP